MNIGKVIGIAGIGLALALGCKPIEEKYRNEGIIQNYAPANGYDVKFGPTIKGYHLAIGNLTDNGFSDSYILAKDFDCDGHIDYFEVSDMYGICYRTNDLPERLDSCYIFPNLRELANFSRLDQLEEGLLHGRR